MRFRALCFGIAISFFAAAATHAATTASAGGMKVSTAVGKPLSEAQKLLNANPPDYKTALDLVHAAQAIPSRTAVDDYFINQFLGQIAAGMKDDATAATAFEAVADSPLIDQDENKPALLQNALILSTAANHYQKAVQYGDKLAALGPLKYSLEGYLAVDYYNLHDMDHARDHAQKSIDGAKAAGAQPDANALVVMSNAQAKSNNNEAAEATLEQLAAQTGTPDTWARLIAYNIDHSKPREIDAINLMRLAIVTDAPMQPADYTLLATLSLRKGYPGDALAASRHGGKAPGAEAKAQADERDLAREASSKSKSGEFDVQLAEDYYGYGKFADAESAARRAISKGGLKDPSEGHMVLGMALTGESRFSDAVQEFQLVSGGMGATKTAHLWMIYAQSRSQPTTAAAH